MARKIAEIKVEMLDDDQLDKPLPAYFLSLKIENVRCFGPEQTLDLSNGEGRPAQWTIILGDNGVGKTTLLQSLVAFAPILDRAKGMRTSGSTPLMANHNQRILMPRFPFYFDLFEKWKSVRNGYYKSNLQLSGTLIFGAKLTSKESNTQINNFFLRNGKDGIKSIGMPYKQLQSEGILCFGYGAGRHITVGSLGNTKDENPVASLFSEDVPLVNAEEWLLQADYAASKASTIRERAVKRRDQIKDILIKLLPDVEDIRFTQLSETQMKPGIEVQTPYGWVAMKDLSLGYKTLIAWMVDLAARLFEEYPDSSNPLAEPAVVLVDEIDLHLHPKWQRSLMSYLSELFPNTQFIVTAHSPLVVQAAEDANIAVLRREGDHVVIDNDVEAIRGWRIDQILTSDLFGLKSARPPQLDSLLAERKKILAKGKLTKKDKEKLRQLEEKIGPLPAGETPEDIEAMDIIRRAAERLKQR